MKTIPYSKFKHGQRVTCEIEGINVTDARISIQRDGEVYICNNKAAGIEAHDLLGYTYSYFILKKNEDYNEEKNNCKNLKFPPRTLDNLEEGDVIVGIGGERKILGVCGEVYFLSMDKDFSAAWTGLTLNDITDCGYTIKQEAEEQEITELTLEDVAKLANVPVEKLRIKDSA